MTLFRRSTAVSCYYCLSRIDPYAASSSRSGPIDRGSLRCPYCACWNRYDSRGQIVGDEPAMHDERLNTESFSKRGLPDRNRLPSLTGQGSSSPFCRTCQTNQTLLINLRAAYLPDPSDPSYATRLAQLPEYIASLQSRYPPVCPSCQPAVDAEIARKDDFARTRALAGALKATSRPLSRVGNTPASVKNSRITLRRWRIRGILWTSSYAIAILANATGTLGFSLPLRLGRLTPLLPLLVLVSVSWMFWDPAYSLQQTSQAPSRKVRIDGRQRYILLQSLAWASRLLSSALLVCSWIRPDWDLLQLRISNSPNALSRRQTYFGTALALELSILILSYFAITIHKPIPIRLIDTSAHRALSQYSNPNAGPSKANDAQTTSQTNANGHGILPEPELVSTLSLSSNPVITPVGGGGVNPMFGQPSLAPAPELASEYQSPSDASVFQDDEDDDGFSRARRQRDPDAMDWEPSTPAKQALVQAVRSQRTNGGSGRSKDDGTWLRQQRFFPPEEPTGLEGLLMRTRLVDGDEPARHAGESIFARRGGIGRWRWNWGWVYGASVLPVVAVLAALWLRSRS